MVDGSGRGGGTSQGTTMDGAVDRPDHAMVSPPETEIVCPVI